MPATPRRTAHKARAAEVAPEEARKLHRALLGWYERERRDLPWRHTRDPYAIWVSEIMLQQTRVETVIPYYDRFLRALPTVRALALAGEDHVMSLWSGLGYYRRARMLHEAAREVTARGGALPLTRDGLLEVRGIGRYTAGAIASIAYGEAAALVDGNVARVLARLFAVKEDVRGGAGLDRIWSLAEALVPDKAPGEWNQALMELGATLCVPRAPRCLLCPARKICVAHARGLEATLPRLASKAAPLAARQVALVATVTTRGGARVLLARRRPGGLFGGMWEPPVVVEANGADPDARAGLQALLGVALPDLIERGGVTHVLTHRRLSTRVVSCELRRAPRVKLAPLGPYDAIAVVAPSDFASLGISTLARKVLSRAGEPLTASSSSAP
jgi:A/G-specific adenine glycosylase